MFVAKLFLKMLRPQVVVALLLFAAVGMAQGGYKQQLAWQFLGVVVIIATWWVNATTINDLADYEIDKINLKGVAERPLANQEASRKQIFSLYILTAMIALTTGFILDIKIGVLVVFCLVLNYVYSMPPTKVSYRGALAPLLLPIGYVVLPFLVGAWSVNENITHKGWLILIAIYISFIGRILLKDFRDVKGDAKFGKLTFLLRYGRKTTCIASAIGLTIGSTILLVVIPHNAIIIAVFEILLACALFGLYQLHKTRSRKKELMIISSVVKTASGVVLILLALLLLQNNSRSPSQQVLVTLGIGTYFFALFWDTINRAGKITQSS